MRMFKWLCKQTQMQLKANLRKMLPENTISEDGFLYYKGTYPVLLVAHMDTVHKEKCKRISYSKGKLSSPQGIGGDDRCGIYMILEILKEYDCSVLFTEDEEIGCVGSRKFAKTEYAEKLDVNYMIQFDRRNEKDAVYYSNGNEKFMNFVEENGGFERAYGSYTDICEIMPVSGICGVNVSCGYYNEHTLKEYVVFKEMLAQIDRAKKLISTETEPWEYQEEIIDYNYGGGYTYGLTACFCDIYSGEIVKKAIYDDMDLLDIFMDYTWLSMDDIDFI